MSRFPSHQILWSTPRPFPLPVVSNSRKQLDSTVGTVKNTVKENVDPVVSNSNDDEWASF